ncbi:MAG: polysaccharide pyruvyl transferase family protein [Rubrivivax sp.]|nr:polysaccharide pyruvyl transferase family protein [Rubrivivax sp.]
MNKAVLIWGAPARVDAGVDYATAFEQSRNNFGNMLIGNAVHSFLSKNEILTPPQLKSPAEAQERCSQVVIPAANWLWKDFDFGDIANFLEKTQLPVTIVGLGAQTNDRTITSPIHPNTMRLMRLIAERSATLGVRGFYTAEVLAANGIHNVEVIGCPSLYTSRCPTVHINTEGLSQPKTLAVNFSRRVIEHSFNAGQMQAVENAVLQMALQHDSTFIAQDELEELALNAGAEVDTRRLEKYFAGSDPAQVVEFFKTRTRWFHDVDSWANFMRSSSLSIGTRFHGNLIALTNGVPALFIIHDSRTMELCTLIGAPSVHLQELTAGTDCAALLAERLASISFSRFEASYAALYRRFVGFLGRNGLDHNLPAPA